MLSEIHKTVDAQVFSVEKSLITREKDAIFKKNKMKYDPHAS